MKKTLHKYQSKKLENIDEFTKFASYRNNNE